VCVCVYRETLMIPMSTITRDFIEFIYKQITRVYSRVRGGRRSCVRTRIINLYNNRVHETTARYVALYEDRRHRHENVKRV